MALTDKDIEEWKARLKKDASKNLYGKDIEYIKLMIEMEYTCKKFGDYAGYKIEKVWYKK